MDQFFSWNWSMDLEKCRLSAMEYSPFVMNEPSLALQSSGVTCKFAITSNDPMTRDEQPVLVFATGTAYGSHSLGRFDALGDLEIGSRSTQGNTSQFLPYALLKRSACNVQKNREMGTFALEVFIQLLDAFQQIFLSRSDFVGGKIVETQGRDASL